MGDTTVNKIKIALIIHSLGLGGMERVMSLLANNFVTNKENIEIHLVLIGKKREIKYPLSSKIHVHKPEFTFSNNKRRRHILKTILFLRKTIKNIDPDSILSFGEMWNNLVLLSLLNLKYKLFISDRSEPNKNLGATHNYLRKWLYPKAYGYIAQTKKAKQICVKHNWNKNVIVIGNPIREIKTNKNIKRENIVLSVGRLIDTKNFDKLIEMFISLNEPDWKLIIVGGDAKKQNNFKKLKTLIKSLNAVERVLLEGFQSNIDEYYLRSKIFAFTSTSEGFPNALGEAMAAGCACISFDCVAGPADLIDDGVNGYLIKLNDYEQYKQKLKKLMHDNELIEKIGTAAIKKINNKFSAEKISHQYFDFITNS